MELINKTPFPGIAFQASRQDGKPSHVAVLRATFDIKSDGILELSDEQEPIVLSDEYFEEPNKSSVRQESDLVPCKPKCDVIVNATAYAPGGHPSLEFVVGVRIRGPAGGGKEHGPLILEKKLVVTGPCCWEKGLMGGWKLTPPTRPVTSLPLRYEYAFGGECRVASDDPCGRRVDAAFRLTPEQRSCHPDGPDMAPLAHAACADNPLGIGFAEDWYLKAKELKEFPAPQIGSPENPVTKLGTSYAPQGFGIITKAWRQRLDLAGTYDEEWREKRWPYLPEDFDVAYWNGAHPDLQTPHLAGDEHIMLTNLTPGGKLNFSLPGHLPFVQALYEDGRSEPAPAPLDTLIIEPDSMKVSLVWRAVLPIHPDSAVVDAFDILMNWSS
jgi:hypothetical protein